MKSKSNKISVLMVTGVYFPEVNGAVAQCMKIISLLKENVQFRVLSATKNRNLLKNKSVEGISVHRTLIPQNSLFYFFQFISIIFFYIKNRQEFDTVHLHGFSSKSAFIILLSKIFRKNIILKLTSFGHDDPESIKRKSRILYFFYRLADCYIGVSPIFNKSYSKLNLEVSKYFLIPNGVDTKLFSPVKNFKEKNILRDKLGLPLDIDLILFIGHFSKEKSALDLLNAWLEFQKNQLSSQTGIVFIGSTSRNNFEVDTGVIKEIKSKSKEFVNSQLFFIEETDNIYEYYQASDIYVLSSLREGLPNTLLEAMSCGLPVISSNLEDITDWIINDSVDGFLYRLGEVNELTLLLEKILGDVVLRKNIGQNARRTIESKFDISFTAKNIHKLYEKLSIK